MKLFKLLPSLVSLIMLINSQAIAGESLAEPLISVQLWSVKDDVKDDIDDTLEKLAKMGFDGVEFAGEFGPYKETPQVLKEKLDSLGLQAPAAHIDLKLLNDENFFKTVAFYKTLGVKYLIDPWEEDVWDAEKIDDVVKLFNDLSTKLKAYGMQIGYHNHAQEFADFQDSTYWDYLAENTYDDVVLQHDFGWIKNAGKSPQHYMEKYNARTILSHYKIVLPEANPNKYSPILGEDNYIDWKMISKTNLSANMPKWLVIEQETYPEGLTPMESVANSKQGLDRLLRKL